MCFLHFSQSIILTYFQPGAEPSLPILDTHGAGTLRHILKFMNMVIMIKIMMIMMVYCKPLNIMQVQSIGPLEWVLNTASHHRVHHGANR